MRESEALCHGKADAQPRKAARARRHGKKGQFLHTEAAGAKRLFAKAQQGFAVSEPRAQAAFINKLFILANGHASGFSGTVQPKHRHSPASSMVMIRSSSASPRRMSTCTAFSPRNQPWASSLHSTATMAPSAR